MQIMKRVQVKQVITEASKQKLKEEFESDKKRLERECEQLLFELRKLRSRVGSKLHVEERFKEEIDYRKEQIAVSEFKIEQLDILEEGMELLEREIDALVKVEVGMNWDELMKKQSIVIKDDKVIRIDYE